MRQFRITSADLNPASDNDCVLDPTDPIHSMMPASVLGGLGSTVALEQYAVSQAPKIAGSDKGQIAREQNIKPGTDAWFKHWFGSTK